MLHINVPFLATNPPLKPPSTPKPQIAFENKRVMLSQKKLQKVKKIVAFYRTFYYNQLLLNLL